MPAGFFQMMEFAISSVRDVTGISVEMLGMREADQAASLEYQRRQAGMTILAPLFDHLKRYRREHGKLMLYIIKNYLNDGRLIRIVGDEGAQYVPLALDAELEYDIIVDDQINSPDQKMMIWQSIMPILPSLPPQVQLALVDYAPLPTAVIEKIKEAAQSLGPSEEEQTMIRAEAEKLVAEVDKIKSETAENIAQARKIASESGEGQVAEARIDAALTARRDNMHAQRDQQALALRAQTEQTKLAQTGQIKREEMSQKAILSVFDSALKAKVAEQQAKNRPAGADNATRA